MANEIIITVPVTTWTISAVLVRRTDGATWNVSTSTWDATQTAARAQYRIPLTQLGSYNMFTASMPSVAAGLYRVAYYREVGANYLPVAEDILQWDGSKVIIAPAADIATAILSTPANKLATNSSGYVTATNGGGLSDSDISALRTAMAVISGVGGIQANSSYQFTQNDGKVVTVTISADRKSRTVTVV